MFLKRVEFGMYLRLQGIMTMVMEARPQGKSRLSSMTNRSRGGGAGASTSYKWNSLRCERKHLP